MVALADDDVAVTAEAVRRASWGCSLVGIVSACGSRAATLIGQRVLVGPIDPCGECDVCRRGGAAVCPTLRRRDAVSRGEPVVAAARWVTPLGDELDLPGPGAAIVAGDVAIAYTLYARTGLAPRDPAVVIGASPVARYLVAILRAKSITAAAFSDLAATPDEARAAIAEAVAAQGLGARPWRILATEPAAASLAAALAGPRASLTLFGAAAALPGALVDREVTVIGVAGAHPDLVVEVAAMCAKGDLDVGAAATSELVDG